MPSHAQKTGAYYNASSLCGGPRLQQRPIDSPCQSLAGFTSLALVYPGTKCLKSKSCDQLATTASSDIAMRLSMAVNRGTSLRSEIPVLGPYRTPTRNGLLKHRKTEF